MVNDDRTGRVLTDEGRDVVEGVVHCYEEVSYEDGEYDTVDQCRAIAKSDGLEHVASGVGRDVFDVGPEFRTADGDYVLKVARNLVGSHENRREIQTWERIPEAARPFLAPVREHGVGWLVMPKADVGPSTHQIQRLLSGLGEAGWGCDDANEAHNIGVVDGHPVVIDYGMGCFEREE